MGRPKNSSQSVIYGHSLCNTLQFQNTRVLLAPKRCREETQSCNYSVYAQAAHHSECDGEAAQTLEHWPGNKLAEGRRNGVHHDPWRRPGAGKIIELPG